MAGKDEGQSLHRGADQRCGAGAGDGPDPFGDMAAFTLKGEPAAAR